MQAILQKDIRIYSYTHTIFLDIQTVKQNSKM